MTKSAVRQQDTVISPSLGNGSVITGDTSVTFQGNPLPVQAIGLYSPTAQKA